LPATISKYEKENTEDDAGSANVDANDNAAQRCLPIPALTQTISSLEKKKKQHAILFELSVSFYFSFRPVLAGKGAVKTFLS